MKYLIVICIVTVELLASSLINLPYAGVKVDYINLQDKPRSILIERVIKTECLNLELSPETIWSKSYANKEVHPNCKKTFVTTKGIIQPIAFNNTIQTVGELEVLDFLKNKVMKHLEKYALIDSRPYEWYEQMTIPGALNVPYDELEISELVTQDEYRKHLLKMGVTTKGTKLDFSNAKTLILFCNGAWCSQSNQAMNKMLALGYPQEKIAWYRGGMHSWTSMSLTTINPKE